MKDFLRFKNKFILRVFLLALVFLGLSAFYLGVVLALPYNSDHASILLEAKSIIDHNFLLKGWTLSTVSDFTTEIPFYIIGILIFGNSDKVIYVVTAVNYALLSLTIIYYCSINQTGQIVFGRLIISVGFLLFIASLLSNWGLLSPVHIVSLTYCLCSLFFLRGGYITINKKSLILSGIFFLLAFVGDTFTIYVWGIPVCIVLFFRSFNVEKRGQCIKLLVTTLFLIAFSQIILHLISLSGGFTVPGIYPPLKYVDIQNLPNNLYLFFIGFFDLFSVNFFGKPVLSYMSWLSLIHFLGLFVFVCALLWTIKELSKQSITNQIFTVAILINLAEYLFGNVAIDRSSVYYLMPSLIFGVILITSFIVESKWYQYKLFIIICCILIGTSLIPNMSRSRINLPVSELDSFLVSHHLKNGYGPYWLASVTTVHSKGAVSIRQVYSPNDDYLHPFYWLVEDNWFSSNATFLVFDNENSFNVNTVTAINTFGKPKDTYRVDNYSVLVWDKNISPDLLKHP